MTDRRLSKEPLPQKAVLLARISDDRTGEEKGVIDQTADGRALAARLGWTLGPDSTHIVVENDTSAFKRKRIRLYDGRIELRTVRPEFRRALDMLANGTADGLIAVDLDRMARQPRDLEDLIDVVESRSPRIPVKSVTGSLQLANDADVTMARIMCAIANKSSRDTARRVQRAALRRVEQGQSLGGARPFGHELAGAVRQCEAEVLTEAVDSILSGVGLSGIVKRLNANGKAMPAPRGGPWTHQSLRDMLLQPRLAGLVAWQGELLEGVKAPYKPILDRPTWEAVTALLTSPERRTTPGPKPRHLLSHIARCGHPDHPDDDRPVMFKSMVGGTRGPRIPAYRCTEKGHLACTQASLDAYVEATVIERLARPDAAELLIPRVEFDMAGLAKQASRLRAGISNLLDLAGTNDIAPAECRKRTGRLSEQLAKIEAEMTAAAGTSPLAGIAGHPEARGVWIGFDLARKRAVIACLMAVTIMPASRRGKRFDSERVPIDWLSPI